MEIYVGGGGSTLVLGLSHGKETKYFESHKTERTQRFMCIAV